MTIFSGYDSSGGWLSCITASQTRAVPATILFNGQVTQGRHGSIILKKIL